MQWLVRKDDKLKQKNEYEHNASFAYMTLS